MSAIPGLLPLAGTTRPSAIGYGMAAHTPYIVIEGFNAHDVSLAVVEFVKAHLHGVGAVFTEGVNSRSHRFRIAFTVYPEEHGVTRGGPVHRDLQRQLRRLVQRAAFEAGMARSEVAS